MDNTSTFPGVVSGSPRKKVGTINLPVGQPVKTMEEVKAQMKTMEEAKAGASAQVVTNPTAEKETAAPVTQTEEPNKTEAQASGEPEIDYKALLAESELRLKKAEFTLRKNNIDSKKAKTVENSAPAEIPAEEVGTEEAEPEVQQDSKLRQLVKEELAVKTIDEIFGAIKNPDERALTKHFYENRLVKTGFTPSDIENDVESARLLANSQKILKERRELSEALKAKHSMSGSGFGTNKDSNQPKEDLSKHFNAEEWAFMQQHNFTPEMIQKAIPRKS